MSSGRETKMAGIFVAIAMGGLLATAWFFVVDKLSGWHIEERIDIEGYPKYTLWKGTQVFGSFPYKGQAESVMRRYADKPTSWSYDEQGNRK